METIQEKSKFELTPKPTQNLTNFDKRHQKKKSKSPGRRTRSSPKKKFNADLSPVR